MTTSQCILCGSTSRKIVAQGTDIIHKTTTRIFTIAQCNACKLVFTDPQPSVTELKNYYPAEYRPHSLKKDTEFYYHRPENPSKNILDVGCGSGDFLEEIAKKHTDWDCYGIDLDPRAVERARARGYSATEGSLEASQYKNDFFDTIFINHVLEHVQNPRTTLKVAHRILKPRGSIVLLLPNYQSVSRILFRSYWYGLDLPRHLYHFTPQTITQLLKNTGFENIRITFRPSPKSFLFSISYMIYGSRGKYPKSIWYLFSPFGYVASLLHLSSVMKIQAIKNS